MVETMMVVNVSTMSERHEWRVRAALCPRGRALRRFEAPVPSRSGVAGRPVWSRAAHDRTGPREPALRTRSSASGCRWANPRFEPTPPDACTALAATATNSLNATAGRSAILSRVVALLRPTARGSSARR